MACVGVSIVLCFLVTVLEGFDIQVLGVAAPVLAPQLPVVVIAGVALFWLSLLDPGN
ncbi:MAG: hypothetical protein ABI645_00330 [Pseudomonadota bacterium]